MQENVFSGIKVLDLGTGIANPISLRYLADYGATVVCVESLTRPNLMRTNQPYKDFKPGINRSGYYACLCHNIRSIALNLDKPEDLEIARKLAEWADVVGDSHRPGVAEKWGLDYESIKKFNPEVIMIRSSNQGLTGPRNGYRGFGNQLNGMAGFVNLCGFPDEDPVCFMMAYTDYFTPHFSLSALAGALEYRRRTGKGQLLDISQLEAGLQFLSTWLLDYSVNGHEQMRRGNKSDCAAPHNVYRCAGDDRWCAICVFTDTEWESFCNVIGNPEWTRRQEFQTFEGRKEFEDELDQLIEQWTCNMDCYDVMHRCQEAGVAAGVVQNARDLYNDPQLNAIGSFWVTEHKEIGRFSHLAQPARLSKTPPGLYRSSPLFDEHKEYVMHDILGLKKEEC